MLTAYLDWLLMASLIKINLVPMVDVYTTQDQEAR